MERILFDRALKKGEGYLKYIGMQIDDQDIYRTTWERLRRRWVFFINVIWITSGTISQAAWCVQKYTITGMNFVDLTNFIPCCGLCILGLIQAVFYMKHMPKVIQLVKSVRHLQTMSFEERLDIKDLNNLKAQTKIFNIAVNSITLIALTGVLGFAINPFATMALHYIHSGEIKLIQPFLVVYPFDTTDIRFYFFGYFHIIWTAVIAVTTVAGPYFTCYAISTFVILQFNRLHKDIEKIIPFENTPNLYLFVMNYNFRGELIKIIDRHKKLIQCVYLMECIYTESALCNVLCSSLLICLTGFNVTAIHNIALTLPFVQFLLFNSVEVFFLCYYGHKITTYSADVGYAVYKCQWYRADVTIAKDLMIIAARANRPCKLTALGFSDINLKTFTKILSTSWSYFALVSSLYNNAKV